jgi:hypothetical protein
MIRPGSLAVAMVIHILELCNLILVCIREGLQSRGSIVGNCKGVKGNCYECIDCAWVAGLFP